MLGKIADVSLYNMSKRTIVKMLILGYGLRIAPLLDDEDSKELKRLIRKERKKIVNPAPKLLPIKRVKPDHKEIRVFGGFNTRYRIMEVDRERLDRLANKIKLTPLGNKLKGEKNGET